MTSTGRVKRIKTRSTALSVTKGDVGDVGMDMDLDLDVPFLENASARPTTANAAELQLPGPKIHPLDSVGDGALLVQLRRFQRKRQTARLASSDLLVDFCEENRFDLEKFLIRMTKITSELGITGLQADVLRKPFESLGIPEPHVVREARLTSIDDKAQTMLGICQENLPAFLQLTTLSEQLPAGKLDRVEALRFPHREAPVLPETLTAAGADSAISSKSIISTASKDVPVDSKTLTKEACALLELIRFAAEVDPRLKKKLEGNPEIVHRCLLGDRDMLRALWSLLKTPLVCRASLARHLLGPRHHAWHRSATAFLPEWTAETYGFRSTDTSAFAFANRNVLPDDLLLDMIQLDLVAHAVTPMLVTVTEDLRAVRFIGFSIPNPKRMEQLRAAVRLPMPSERDQKLHSVYKRLLDVVAKFRNKPKILQQFEARLDYFCLFLLGETFGVAASERIECLRSTFNWTPSSNFDFAELHHGKWICLVPDENRFGGPVCPPWYEELVVSTCALAIHPRHEMSLAMARGMDGRPSTFLTRRAEATEKLQAASFDPWEPGMTLFSSTETSGKAKEMRRINFRPRNIQGRLVPPDFVVKSAVYNQTVEGDKSRAIHEFDVKIAALCMELGVQPRSEMRPCPSDKHFAAYELQVYEVMQVCQAILRGKLESLALNWMEKERAIEID